MSEREYLLTKVSKGLPKDLQTLKLSHVGNRNPEIFRRLAANRHGKEVGMLRRAGMPELANEREVMGRLQKIKLKDERLLRGK